MKFQFLDTEHKQQFQKLRTGLAEYYRFDKEHLTLCFIMAGNKELLEKMSPYFDGVGGTLDSYKMFEEQDFSSGLDVLAKLAVHLYNSDEIVTPQAFIRYLDERSLQLALNAILIRVQGISNEYPLIQE